MIEILNGWLTGHTVHPTNADYNDKGSIHDDATAASLGFRGGTIAGSAHLDTVVPLCVHAFGQSWFESGAVSMYFRHATTDGEPTIARITAPPSGVRDWLGTVEVVTPEGVVVGDGTVSVGAPSQCSALDLRDLRHDVTDLRILANLEQGEAIVATISSVSGTRVKQRCASGAITEPLDWYVHTSPWGEPIAPPSAVIDLVSKVCGDVLLPRIASSVGMWGAMEVRFRSAPVPLDTELQVAGEITALSSSPKTEVLWLDASVADAASLRTLATVRIQNRFVKASSPLWG